MVVASESEKVIRRLYQITNDYQKGFDIQITQLIMMGLERFNLDIGILSRIDGELYTVLYCVTSEGVELKPGDYTREHRIIITDRRQEPQNQSWKI